MLLRIVPLICMAALGSSGVSDLGAGEHPSDWAELKERRHARSAERAGEPRQLVTRAYAVADLVTAPPALAVVSFDTPVGNSRGPERRSPDFETLIERMTGTIHPASWNSAGGPGSVEAQRKTLSLIVTHTAAVHEQIADLLARLRREQDVQVTVEVRCLGVAGGFFERLGEDFDFDSDAAHPIFETRAAKRLLEAAQGDSRSNILSAPKVTLSNGQTLWISSTSHAAGHSVVLHPAISPDRRSTRLTVAARGMEPGAPAILHDTIRVPDGQALLLDCGPRQVGASKPTAGRLLDAARLRTDTEKPDKPGRTLLLITPRILVQEEEEELLGLPPVAQTSATEVP